MSHNVGEETPILSGMARDFCRNVRSLVKPKERYLDEEIISEIIADLVTMLRKIPHKEKFAFSTALAFGNIDKQAGKSEEPAANIAHLFDILNCLLIPTENLNTFVGSLKEKKPVCGRVFLDGDLAYTCLDCRTDATCVICEECFNNSNHVGHRVRYHRTSAGGICDCGDAEAWKPEGFCDQHCGLGNNQKTTNEIFGHKVEDDSRLPEQFQRACEIIVNFVVKYLTLYSMQDYGSFSILPESPKDSTEDIEWIVCLHNDDKHTYQNVIEATTNTFSLIESLTTLKFLSPDKKKKAQELTKNVDERGYGIVYRGEPEICKQVAKKLKDYGLLVSIKSATWEIDTAISIFFISWLRSICNASASMATLVTKIICNLDVAKNPYVSICETKGFDFTKKEKSPLKNVMDTFSTVNAAKGSPGSIQHGSKYSIEELKHVKLYTKFKNFAVFWVPGFINVTPIWYAYNENKAEWTFCPQKPRSIEDLEKFASVTRFQTLPRRYGLELATINKNVISFLSENPDLSRNYLNGSTREVPWEERKCKRQKMWCIDDFDTAQEYKQ